MLAIADCKELTGRDSAEQQLREAIRTRWVVIGVLSQKAPQVISFLVFFSLTFVASRLEAIASRLEAIASSFLLRIKIRLEAIAVLFFDLGFSFSLSSLPIL